ARPLRSGQPRGSRGLRRGPRRGVAGDAGRDALAPRPRPAPEIGQAPPTLTARRIRRLMPTADEATWDGHGVEESRRHGAAPRGVSGVVRLFVPLGERDRAERAAEMSSPGAAV